VAEFRTTLVPNGSDSLDGNVLKVVPKVTSSRGALVPVVLSPSYFIPLDPGAGGGGGRAGREGKEQGGGRVHGQQWLYG
jgi:hypothetical protein